MASRKIAVLGAGKAGEALISGLLSSGWRKPSEITATVRHEERLAELSERHGIETTLSNVDAAAGAGIVIIAVKPQDIESLLADVGSTLTKEQTVLTIAAAIPTALIESRLGTHLQEEHEESSDAEELQELIEAEAYEALDS